MPIKQICSLQHPLVKKVVRIRKKGSFRAEQQLVFVPGKKSVTDLAATIAVDTLFYVQEKPNIAAKNSYAVSYCIMKKISGLPAPEPVAALFPYTASTQELLPPLLILDELADPGNVGTLFRTAWAFGWPQIVITPTTADPLGEKAIRASKGAALTVPYQTIARKELINTILQNRWLAYLADLKGSCLNSALPIPDVVILSSEAKGAAQDFAAIAEKVTIPMNHLCDSLNVAACGNILLHHFSRLKL